jgi:hypothetical protein
MMGLLAHFAACGALSVLALPVVAAAADLTGHWGGDRLNIIFDASGGHISYDCGTGEIAPGFKLSQHGTFKASGIHDTYAPGAEQADSRRRAPIAQYIGHVSGDTLKLEVRVAGQKTAQHYVLIRNRRVKLVRCL